MAVDYVVKAGTRPGPLAVTLTFSDGSEPDLLIAGTTATFRMRPFGIDPAIVTGDCVILSKTMVGCPWEDTDLDGLDGLYELEVAVVWTSGRRETFPAEEGRPFITVLVQPVIAV